MQEFSSQMCTLCVLNTLLGCANVSEPYSNKAQEKLKKSHRGPES